MGRRTCVDGVESALRQSGTTERISSVQFAADGQRGWAVGARGVIATVDGGKIWAAQTSGTTSS